jgi:hypothetical protein
MQKSLVERREFTASACSKISSGEITLPPNRLIMLSTGVWYVGPRPSIEGMLVVWANSGHEEREGK